MRDASTFEAKLSRLAASSVDERRAFVLDLLSAHEVTQQEEALAASAVNCLSRDTALIDAASDAASNKRIALAVLSSCGVHRERIVELTRDPDLAVRARAHRALAKLTKVIPQGDISDVVSACVWQWQQDSQYRRELSVAVRLSFEAVAGRCDLSALSSCAPRGRCIALEIVAKKRIVPRDLWLPTVFQGLSSTDGGLQRAAAALAATASSSSSSSLALIFADPSTREAAAQRLAPLLSPSTLRSLAASLDELYSGSTRRRVRAKLAAFSRKSALALELVGRDDLVAALDDGRLDVRIAALVIFSRLDDDLFVAAVRSAVIEDAVAFPGRERARAARVAVKRQEKKGAIIARLLRDVVTEGLKGDQYQQLASCDLLGVFVLSLPATHQAWSFLDAQLLLDVMLASTWDRVRLVVYDALALLLPTRTLDDRDLADRIEPLLRGPDYCQRDAGAKLVSLIAMTNVCEEESKEKMFWSDPAAICERYLEGDLESDAAPGALLALSTLKPEPENDSCIIAAVRRALAETATLLQRDDTADNYDDDDDDGDAKRQRGWHMCRGALACVEAHASRKTAAECCESILEDVMLTTGHSGVIAAAQSTLERVAAAHGLEDKARLWLLRCKDLCLNGDIRRCAMRRSAGLASALVALITVTGDASVLERLLCHVEDGTTVNTARCLHCIAAAIWRCSCVPSNLYARVLASALARADDMNWAVRSASSVAVAAVVRKCSQGTTRETTTTQQAAVPPPRGGQQDEDSGAFARFPGLFDALLGALQHGDRRTNLFAALNALSRFGSDAKRSSRLELVEVLVDILLTHHALSIRGEAAAALATVLHDEEDVATQLVSTRLSSVAYDDANAAHGALLACRRLVNIGPATSRAVGLVVTGFLRHGALPPISIVEAAGAAALFLDRSDMRDDYEVSEALDDLETRMLTAASTYTERRSDVAPGESMARAQVCALAVSRRLRERSAHLRISQALDPLESVDDECAVAVASSVNSFVTSRRRIPLDARDDMEEGNEEWFNSQLAINATTQRLLLEVCPRCVELCNTSPARRAACLRLALRIATAFKVKFRLPTLLNDASCSRWAYDVQAVALQLRAACWSPSEDDEKPLVAAIMKAAEKTSPMLLRRGAARALGLAPQLLLVGGDALFIATINLVSASPDVETRVAASRALGIFCDCDNAGPPDDGEDVDDEAFLAPHAALRCALRARHQRSKDDFESFLADADPTGEWRRVMVSSRT